MRLPPLCFTAAALLAATLHGPVHAERTPLRALPLAADNGGSQNARVIVKFRDSASTLRAHALSATAAAPDVSSALSARASSLGARHGLVLRAGGAVGERAQVVRAEGIGSRDLAARLAMDPEVEYAEADRRVRRVAVPNDPFFTTVAGSQGPASGQWYLGAPAGEVQSAINATLAWDTTMGSANVVVAVLDTGVRLDHPDLAGKLLPGYDMINDADISNDGNGRDADPSDPGDWLTAAEINAGVPGDPAFWDGCEASDSSWHGTQVSGIIAAATNNGVGMAGSGWNARVLPVRVLGKCFGYTSDIVAGMRWAAGLPVAGVPTNPNPAKVLNLSLGSSGACSQSEADAVVAVNAVGAVVVAAAGNSAGRAAGSPANCAGAIGVAGVRHAGSKVGFSDVGPEIAIAAPGGNCVNLTGACLYPILTTVNSGAQSPGANTYSDAINNISVGTSFSAPLVSGTAALLYAVRADLTAAQLRATLQSSARPFPASGLPPDPGTGAIQTCQAPGSVDQLQCYCTTSTCGAGMLNAGAAVAVALGLGAAIHVTPASPQAGQTITFGSQDSTASAGRSIVAWQWTLVDGGGVATGFGSATNGATATVVPVVAGTVTVRLTVTDSMGAEVSAQQSVAVAAAAVTPPPATGGGGGGGGAMSWAWLLGMALASAALLAIGRAKRA